jgi:LEA14-like dessication related protein
MNTQVCRNLIPGLALCGFLSGCATGTEALVSTPAVDLKSVEVEKVSFTSQTVLLGFQVENPNAFPLPVRAVKYRIMFDDERFAGGETRASFTVPARGADDFVLSVELDIVNSATEVMSMLKGGMPEHVEYRVDGSLTVDIPFARPLPFSSSGMIQVRN